MGIWIRTQDKETLINCECIQVNEIYSRDGGFCLKTDIDGSPVYLGAYKTKEKALQVLDEIQKLLVQPIALLKADMPQCLSDEGANKYSEQIFDFCKQYNFIYVGSKDVEVIPTNNTNIVYQMPEK